LAPLGGLGTFEGVTGVMSFDGSGDPRRSAALRKIHDDATLHCHQRVPFE